MRTLNAAAEASTPAQAPADDGVRHAAWFAILAGTPRDTPMWPALFAGFELLRLIDHGIARPGWRRPGLHRSRDARAAVKLVRYHPAHPLLERVLQAIDRDSQSGITLVDALAAYASQLDGDGLRAVAEDVYETAARVGYARHVPGMAARVYVGWARCRRELDRCQDADATIAAGLDLARQADDVITELTLQISHACLAMHQGCFETAATRLDEVLARAAALDLPEIEAIASHDRGVCAHELGRPARALEYYERAFLHHATPAGRMRVINDIGRAFAELDHHDSARAACITVHLEHADAGVRHAATINLIDLARREGRADTLNHYIHDLAAERLSARLQAAYDRHVRGAAERALDRTLTDCDVARIDRLVRAVRDFSRQHDIRL